MKRRGFLAVLMALPWLAACRATPPPTRTITIVLQGEGAPSADYIRRTLIPALNKS
jgi:hypothetical protein